MLKSRDYNSRTSWLNDQGNSLISPCTLVCSDVSNTQQAQETCDLLLCTKKKKKLRQGLTM